MLFSESNEGEDELDALLGEPVAPAEATESTGASEEETAAPEGGIQDDLDDLLGGEGDLDAELGDLLSEDMSDNEGGETTAESRDFSTGVHTMLVNDPDQAIADAMAELNNTA